ncbi:MAG: DMT family transporter [Acidobacteria bacterium]|nr:DMT family transporter [Acidobacteriota bacterium]
MAVWLIPTLTSLLLYGIGQGLVKKYIAEVPPARFCLYFVIAKILLNSTYYVLFRQRDLLAAGTGDFALTCIVAYLLDGLGWLLYFQAIVHGPIAIVGTLSAAYPALTVVFARLFLGETLIASQYAGVALVIAGCVGLSYAPAPPGSREIDRRWIPLSFIALVLWGCSSTLLKAAYRLPGADEVVVMIYSLVGAVATLGVYGVARGRGDAGGAGGGGGGGWLRSLLPMGMLAGGDIGFIVATRYGPVSLTTPLSGAYPIVTVLFARLVLGERIGGWQAACIAAILGGMALAPGPG